MRRNCPRWVNIYFFLILNKNNCSKVCATRILVMGFLIGLFPLHNEIFFMITIKEIPSANRLNFRPCYLNLLDLGQNIVCFEQFLFMCVHMISLNTKC